MRGKAIERLRTMHKERDLKSTEAEEQLLSLLLMGSDKAKASILAELEPDDFYWDGPASLWRWRL